MTKTHSMFTVLAVIAVLLTAILVVINSESKAVAEVSPPQAQQTAEPVSCQSDIDGDGEVGIMDFLMLLADWGPCGPPGRGGIPVGAIVMWSGTVVPDGWALCDGLSGTPDLRDRFIFSLALPEVGETGGSDIHGHSLSSHNHNTGTADPSGGGMLMNGTGLVAHDHGFTGLGGGGTTTSFNHRPPYYGLAFIMKL